MKKMIRLVVAALALSFAMTGTVLAAEWVKEDDGFKYKKGSKYAEDEWIWLDPDGDGVLECFYFGRDQYLVTDGETPDRYQVNSNGAWVVNGVVQTRMSGKVKTEEIERIQMACAAYYYVNENMGKVDVLGKEVLTGEQKISAARLAQISAALGLYPGNDQYNQDNKVVYDSVKLRQIMFDLYGFRLEECTAAPDVVQRADNKYQVQAGDFGVSWPYCSLKKTGNTPNGYIFTGTVGDAAGIPGVLSDKAKKTGNVYQEQHPVSVQVVYNSTGTFCKFRIQEIKY